MNMLPRELLRQLAVGEVHFIHTLEPFRPYTLVNVERIAFGHHRWSIVTVKEGPDSYRNVLLTRDAFTTDSQLV